MITGRVPEQLGSSGIADNHGIESAGNQLACVEPGQKFGHKLALLLPRERLYASTPDFQRATNLYVLSAIRKLFLAVWNYSTYDRSGTFRNKD